MSLGVRGLEPRTSALSELRSNHLSYTPRKMFPYSGADIVPRFCPVVQSNLHFSPFSGESRSINRHKPRDLGHLFGSIFILAPLLSLSRCVLLSPFPEVPGFFSGIRAASLFRSVFIENGVVRSRAMLASFSLLILRSRGCVQFFIPRALWVREFGHYSIV
jgi:hypothetical protein